MIDKNSVQKLSYLEDCTRHAGNKEWTTSKGWIIMRC
jgi:hypothetical protein